MRNQYQINTEKWYKLINKLKKPLFTDTFYWGQYYHHNIDNLRPIHQDSYCQVKVWSNNKKTNKYIVLFTEKYGNNCLSITNASEKISTAFLKLTELRYEQCLFFESYPYYDRLGKIYFDGVEYEVTEREKTEILTKPKWVDRTEEFINLLKI